MESMRGVPEGPTGYEMLLEGAHVITVVALIAVCVTRLQAGEDKWRKIFDGGILATAVSSQSWSRRAARDAQ